MTSEATDSNAVATFTRAVSLSTKWPNERPRLSKLRTYGKSLLGLGNRKHDPLRCAIGHCSRENTRFCL